MTREEILSMNLKKGDRILVEVDVFEVNNNEEHGILTLGKYGFDFETYNESIHSILRVEKNDSTRIIHR